MKDEGKYLRLSVYPFRSGGMVREVTRSSRYREDISRWKEIRQAVGSITNKEARGKLPIHIPTD